IQVNGAFRAEAETVLADGHVPGVAAVEILFEGLNEAGVDPLTQGLADVDVLSRDAKRHRGSGRSSPRRTHRRLLVAAPLHRGRYTHGLAVFCDGSPRDVDTRLAQLVDDRVVGQDVLRALRFDHLPDAVTHRFGRVGLAAVGGGDRRREEIFQLEYAA